MANLQRLGKILEPLMLVTGIVSLMATIPQLYKLFFSHTQHAAGLSQVTWVLYALITLLWAIYGLYHKKPALWVGNALSFVMD